MSAPVAARANALPHVGIVGIGAMGGAMARRLHRLGHPPAVCDIDPAALDAARRLGLPVQATPAALASRCAVVLVVVVDAPQVEEVLFGPEGVAHARRDSPGAVHTVVLCPTIGPADTERFAARLQAIGIAAIDAPVSGGPARAERGEMSMMVAAPAADLARCQALLDCLAAPLHVVGERHGDGARSKLVNNLLAGIHLAAAGEAMALACGLGLDPQRLAALVQASSGASWILGDRMPRALAGDLAPRARTQLLAKDLGLALAMAAQAGHPLPLGEQALARFRAAIAAGHGDDDDAVLIDLSNNLSGTTRWAATARSPGTGTAGRSPGSGSP